jgi:hypothetical protein
MKTRNSPYFMVGISILAVYLIIERFVQPIDPLIAIPVLLLSIVLILTDAVSRRLKNRK